MKKSYLSASPAGLAEREAKDSVVSDLARRILRKGIGSMRRQCVHCSSCQRTPVPGEFVHRLESGRAVCSLCLPQLRPRDRAGATAERVHASERHLPVAPRAA